MWDSIKPAIQMSGVVCGHPQKYIGSTLMSIHSTDMHCYKGNVRSYHLLFILNVIDAYWVNKGYGF